MEQAVAGLTAQDRLSAQGAPRVQTLQVMKGEIREEVGDVGILLMMERLLLSAPAPSPGHQRASSNFQIIALLPLPPSSQENASVRLWWRQLCSEVLKTRETRPGDRRKERILKGVKS